ncbi:RNB-domain-containing protein [Plenodomus tracheiphilus IPT5]|uniref:RNB-domain-containing protein n=1 Tax=Plenodomus tracheiphilus IPT5 TaxID=1408161 RepID=A0A6A7BAF8_9PLEO|nr:RNB-domain-containing protein [Plenodomus tracheiphilus IPT5]
MYPRSGRAASDICWRCQWRILNTPSRNALGTGRKGFPPLKLAPVPSRPLHITATRAQLTPPTSTPSPDLHSAHVVRPANLPFKHYLKQWAEEQEQKGHSAETLSAFENFPTHQDVQNGLSKLSPMAKADQHDDTTAWENTEEDEVDELITIGLFLKPGDVVELRQQSREPVLAVFVQQFDNVSQFYSINGRWTHSISAKVAFAITGYINPELLQPLIPYLPTNPAQANPKGELHVPLTVGAPVQASLERLAEEAELVYRTNAPILDTAYDLLADPARTRMMTLTRIAKLLLSPGDDSYTPSPAALLAVRKALNHNEFRFRSDIRSHRMTNVFAIRSKSDVRTVETVHDWIREYCEHLATHADQPFPVAAVTGAVGAKNIEEFLVKARRLVKKSRKDRDPILGGLGPSKSRAANGNHPTSIQCTWGEAFTDADQQIINFLQAWVLTGQFRGMAGLHAACASLIHATGCYGKHVLKNVGSREQSAGEVNRGRAMMFLQEIGVLSPHENRALYDETLMLPTVRLSRNMELLSTKAQLIQRNPDFRDSMANLRRDWGSTTIYCIDDVGAHEIDDGVSIERIEGKPFEYWIHVHVANPTAFFDKTHTLSGLAVHMTESVYTPERIFPMIPSWATQGFFSLEQGRPVITFSSRIDSSGTVLETKIQHGIIRNIVTITPSELATLLGEQATGDYKQLIVGGAIPDPAAKRTMPQLSPDQLRDLQDLYTASKARWETRKAAGALRLGYLAPNIRLFENTDHGGLTSNPPSMERARLVQGDPVIELTNIRPPGLIGLYINARDIVEEMMVLACHSAALWCSERNIPVMYRGTVDPPMGNGQTPEQIKQAVLELLAQGREVPLVLGLQYTRALGRAIAHTAPLAHKAIGVPSYVKVTSPLRRFSDMIAHWQIEGALRHEARTGRKFDGLKDTAQLPLSQRQMQESIVTLSPRERIIAAAQHESLHYWCSVAFMRAFNYGEGELPDSFKFWVRLVPDAVVRISNIKAVGQLPEYGISANMLYGTDVQVGDVWEVKLDSVDVFSRTILVAPVRLLTREAAIP